MSLQAIALRSANGAKTYQPGQRIRYQQKEQDLKACDNHVLGEECSDVLNLQPANMIEYPPFRHPCESRGPVRVLLRSNARRKRTLGWAVSAQRTKSVLFARRTTSGFLRAQERRRDPRLFGPGPPPSATLGLHWYVTAPSARKAGR